MRTKMLLSQKKVSKLTRRIKALADDVKFQLRSYKQKNSAMLPCKTKAVNVIHVSILYLLFTLHVSHVLFYLLYLMQTQTISSHKHTLHQSNYAQHLKHTTVMVLRPVRAHQQCQRIEMYCSRGYFQIVGLLAFLGLDQVISLLGLSINLHG